MDQRNENGHFVSGLKPPSIVHSPNKLSELSASSTNARYGSMPPPTKGHTRETLVERAGKPARQTTAHPGSKPVTSFVNGTSLVHPRANSFSSSVSSGRPPSSASSRTISNSSYSSSVGYGSRPPSASSTRPPSRLQKPGHGNKRPASSLEIHDEEPNTAQVLGKRKGRTPISSVPSRHPYSMNRNRDPGSNHVSSLSMRKPHSVMSLREFSLATALGGLNLDENPPWSTPTVEEQVPLTPSHIPLMVPRASRSVQSSPSKSPKKKSSVQKFLTKDTNSTTLAWDPDERFEEVNHLQKKFVSDFHGFTSEGESLKELKELYKKQAEMLEVTRAELVASNAQLQSDLEAARARISSSSDALADERRKRDIEIDDLQRQHRRDIEDVKHEAETEQRRAEREYVEQAQDLERNFETLLAAEKVSHEREVEALSSKGATTQHQIERELESQRATIGVLETGLEGSRAGVARERDINDSLRDQLAAAAKKEAELEISVRRLEGHIHFLESDNKSQSQAFADLEERMQNALRTAAEANEKLIKEETLRRKLHNQVQELKGNIRVFCRVRPSLGSDPVESTAKINYPDEESDSKEVEVLGQEEKSSLGTVTTKKHAFAFDRVFGPGSHNEDVFGEISQLVQSALDGYNVCIFCYGQTGSGKTFTMSTADGMIPRAVNQIYSTAKSLEEKGWKYSMEGSFIEVYNENLNDLLGRAEDLDKKKHEIRHDMQNCKTEITGIRTVELDSPGRVEEILQRASKNRSVAATQANERSSRSHSVFILKLIGENSITGERSEGTLNLVDLAGSERLSHSGATGDRLKETQNINKSLSCLGDVIGALGQGKDGGHIPYRNSKLTYLLQFSLGGNSKTLMFVMISPLQAHLSETLTSLKFATKVHNTHIGTAKKQTKTS